MFLVFALMNEGSVFQTHRHSRRVSMRYDYHQVIATKAVDTASFVTFHSVKHFVYPCTGTGERWFKVQGHVNSSKCKNFELNAYLNGKIKIVRYCEAAHVHIILWCICRYR